MTNTKPIPNSPDYTPPLWAITRFSALDFQPRNGRGSGDTGLTMPGGYWVEKHWMLATWSMFWRNEKNLSRLRRHTAEALCADPDWRDRHRGEQIKLGRCIKYCSENGILPLILANPESQGVRTYWVAKDFTSAPRVR